MMNFMHAISRREMLAGSASLLVAGACTSAPESRQTSKDGGAAPARADLYDCEGCEGALERPAGSLRPYARIAPPGETGQPLRVEGIVWQADGRTPAPNVVIYAYQTDAAGLYSRGTPETEASRRHGLLRGWVRTGPDGRYSFDTVKPGPYPRNNFPAHIHLTVLEPGRRPYWIDDIVFEGEFGVTDQYRRERENRGGNGIVRLTSTPDYLVARRDIILERHPE
jgi:protocatechuate 3,4-dioxygenase beta subunit